MSRVDDDRDAARLAERLIQERKLTETQAKKRQEGESAFSKLVQQSQAEKGQQAQQKQQAQQPQGLARAVLARATQDKSVLGHQGKTFDERVQSKMSGETAQATPGRQSEGEMATTRREDSGTSELRAQNRQVEGREDKRTSETRDSDLTKAGDGAAAAGRASGQKGDLKADADSGGKGGGGSGKDGKKEGGAEMAAGFRFNPALMAPVPVAKPKENTGSEKLRALASEIAQKIVERVRVGTNAAGNAEFQIDLRGDVLSGLSIKVSAKNGKISAVFSGSNREVLKMLEQQSEGLKSALGGRGLSLEQLRFEAKT